MNQVLKSFFVGQKLWTILTPLIYDCLLVKDFWVQGSEFIKEVINADLDLPLPLVVLISASPPRGKDTNVENVLNMLQQRFVLISQIFPRSIASTLG